MARMCRRNKEQFSGWIHDKFRFNRFDNKKGANPVRTFFAFRHQSQNKRTDFDQMKVRLFSCNVFGYCLLACVFASFSCASENKTAETDTPTPAPKLPTEEQIMEIGIQKLDEWVSYWKEKGADMHDLKLGQEYEYEPLEWPGENVFTDDSPLKKYQIPHPTAEGVVDIYSYKLVFGEDHELSFNPDSEVVYYRKDGMRERLLFMGPSGTFEDAVWVTEDHLLVSGHIQKENGFVPVVWLINPGEHKYNMYEVDFSTQDYAPESYLKVKLEDLGQDF
jgi:hypothetical protein